MTRRRRPGDQDQPLFGKDWWVSDQRLFQNAVTCRTAPVDTARSLLLAPLGDQARCQDCRGTGKVTYDPDAGEAG
jgi:hypothetical protein